MTIASVRPHPNADTLRIYTLDAPGTDGLVVVGNLEATYAVGEVVAVARIGARLADGTQIRKARLRGVDSFGLVVDRVDAAPGTELSARFGAAPATQGVALAKWSSIELLHHVRTGLAKQHEADDAFTLPKLRYRAKVKLDGTNAAVHALADGVAAQSRTRLLTPQDDNYGFAGWLAANAAWARGLFPRLGRAVVYGEWCGQGIQKRTAVSRVGRKVFAIFAAQLGDPARGTARLLVDPARLRALVPEHPDVFVLPWHGDPVDLDFGDAASLQRGADQINAMVARVEARDPWVADTLGVEGLGEGVVLYPEMPAEVDEAGTIDRDRYTALMFKAKGEAHRVAKQKKPAQIDPEVARSVAEFVALMVTEARLAQALEEGTGGDVDMRRLGEFLKAVATDVRKEGVVELEAANLTWKQVASAITARAKAWFVDRGRT
ncbi:MAG: RNA ligase family protein [Myxococcota bacterium]